MQCGHMLLPCTVAVPWLRKVSIFCEGRTVAASSPYVSLVTSSGVTVFISSIDTVAMTPGRSHSALKGIFSMAALYTTASAKSHHAMPKMVPAANAEYGLRLTRQHAMRQQLLYYRAAQELHACPGRMHLHTS